MSKTQNQKIIRLAIFVACVGILIFLAIRFFIMVREARQNPQIPAPASVPQLPSVNIRHTETQAIQGEDAILPTITYRDHRFIPLTTTLEQNVKSTGCVLKIENQSDAPLTIRLSPHEKALKGNYGGQYPPIPPGKSIIIDPRFDMGYESFHNFNIPAEEFHVAIGNSCRNDL